MKHTPGPWQVVETPDSEDQFGVFGTKDVCDSLSDSFYPMYEPVCKLNAVVDHEKNTYTINEKDKANARLIAAAPDLLEACKAVVERATMIGDIHRPSPMVVKCIQAIAKAEGK